MNLKKKTISNFGHGQNLNFWWTRIHVHMCMRMRIYIILFKLIKLKKWKKKFQNRIIFSCVGSKKLKYCPKFRIVAKNTAKIKFFYKIFFDHFIWLINLHLFSKFNQNPWMGFLLLTNLLAKKCWFFKNGGHFGFFRHKIYIIYPLKLLLSKI